MSNLLYFSIFGQRESFFFGMMWVIALSLFQQK